MKKLSLFVAALFMSVTMFAQTASFYAQSVTAPGTDDDVVIPDGEIINQTFTNAAASITFTKNNKSTSNAQKGAVRWYQDDVMTVTPATGATITEIVWTIAKDSKGAPTCESGTIEGAGTTEGSTVTWTGSENGQFDFVAAKQVRFSSMVITYSTGSSEPVALTGLAINPATASVAVGKTVTLKAVKTPSNATASPIWSSADPAIATVDNGVVTGVKEGTVTITVAEGEIKATCEVTVTAAPVIPDLTKELTVAEALQVIESLEMRASTDVEVTVVGYVTEVIENAIAEHGNETFWMDDTKEGGQALQVFRGATSQLATVGAKVKVVGKLKKYQSGDSYVPEFNSGAAVTILEQGETPQLPTQITGVQYADAWYYVDAGGYPTWDIELYADYDEETKVLTYPYVYFIIDANYETKLNGTYDLYYAGYWYTENDSVEAYSDEQGYPGTLTITCKGGTIYNFNATFAVDGTTYTLNQDVDVYAVNDDEGYDIELEDNATAIEETRGTKVQAQKVMREGKIVIIGAKHEYSVDGKLMK